MTVSGRWERRHSEEFAAASGQATVPADLDREVADLVRVADTLRWAGSEPPRPEFVQGLRARLMEAAAAATTGAAVEPDAGSLDVAPARPAALGQRRRLSAVAAAVAVTGAAVSVGSHSAQAMPGDVLYPLKRGIENAQVALELNDTEAGSSRLELAGTRLEEVRAVVNESNGSRTASFASRTLDDFSAQVEQGGASLLTSYADLGDQAVLEDLASFTRGAREALAALSQGLPASAQKSHDEATDAVRSLSARVEELCSACAVPATRLPEALETGLRDLAAEGRTASEPSATSAADGSRQSVPRSKDGDREREGRAPTGDPEESTGPQDLEPPMMGDSPSTPEPPGAVDDLTGFVGRLTDRVADELPGPVYERVPRIQERP